MAYPHDDDDELPPDPLDEGPGTREGRGATGFVPEFVRKAAVAGLGAVFMTEEGIRSLAGQLKLPKEMLGVILSQAEKTKTEVGRVALRGDPPASSSRRSCATSSSSCSRG